MDEAIALEAAEGLRWCARAEREVRARRVAWLCQLAESYHVNQDDVVEALVDAERRIGGSGTPLVSQFLGLEVGPLMGCSEAAALAALADALDLKYRHPELYAAVLGLEVDAYRALAFARKCRPLSEAAAADVTRRWLRWQSRYSSLAGALELAERIMIEVDAEWAAEQERLARESRGVWLWGTQDGVTNLTGRLDVLDGRFLDAQVARIAELIAPSLPHLNRDQLRARATGILAHPAYALRLLQEAAQQPLIEDAPPEGVSVLQLVPDPGGPVPAPGPEGDPGWFRVLDGVPGEAPRMDPDALEAWVPPQETPEGVRKAAAERGRGRGPIEEPPPEWDPGSEPEPGWEPDPPEYGWIRRPAHFRPVSTQEPPCPPEPDGWSAPCDGSPRGSCGEGAHDPLCGRIVTPAARLRPELGIAVHIHADALGGLTGAARIERAGHITTALLGELLREGLTGDGMRIRVQPVIDLPELPAEDGYVPSRRMRTAIQLAMPTDMFPYSRRSSRNLDIDHTISFDACGGTGQTRLGNLLPASRRPHRGKTAELWGLAQPEPGVAEWTSPLGYRYRVTRDGSGCGNPTTPLGRPRAACGPDGPGESGGHDEAGGPGEALSA